MDNNLDIFLKKFQNELDKQEESSTKSNFSSYGRKGKFNDVPTVDDDDDEYRTHIAMPFTEANEESDDEEEQTATPPEGDMPEESEIEDDMEDMSDKGMSDKENMPQSNMSGMGGIDNQDTSMLDQEDEGPESKEEVGQAFEMKKIYARLVSIESFLNATTDDELVQVRNKISNAIQLFRTVISNFDLYKEKIDDIIVQYYKFITQVYNIITKKLKNT